MPLIARTLAAIAFVFAALPALAEGRDFLVPSEWLEEHIDDDNLVVLEVRYYPHRYFTIGHIPGAVQVQRFKDLGDNDSFSLMGFPSREAFQATLRRWGVNDDSTIVLYDDSNSALASRLWFLLDLYGFDMTRVKLLDGGVLAWQGFNDLSQQDVRPAPGNVTLAEADPGKMVNWQFVYDRIVSRREPQFVLLDARPEAHYTGEVLAHAVRGGHIPGAINIVSLSGTNEDATWKSPEELAKMYADLPRHKTIIAYCHDGFRMSLAYMQLKSLGFEDVRLLDGGWGFWGNKFSLPVVEGPEPFDDNFRL
ncbi:MAG: sulfurtransferase [Alphaproteobacteria bacterium]|nr:MAG: sulfurtransferase [Alphaproteobacteria bacterium]